MTSQHWAATWQAHRQLLAHLLRGTKQGYAAKRRRAGSPKQAGTGGAKGGGGGRAKGRRAGRAKPACPKEQAEITAGAMA